MEAISLTLFPSGPPPHPPARIAQDFMSETLHTGDHFGGAHPEFGQTWTEEALQVAKDPPPLPSQLTVRARLLHGPRAP